jgi:hypothetical protein
MLLGQKLGHRVHLANRSASAGPAIAEPTSPGWRYQRRSASPNVSRGHPPEFEFRSAGCHDWVLRGELAQCLLVIGLHNRKAVRVVVGEDRSEHDHVAALEVRAPVGSMAIHDLPLRVSQTLGEVRARSYEAQDKGGHAADSTPPDRAIECPTSARGRQLVRRNAPMAAMESSCVVIV